MPDQKSNKILILEKLEWRILHGLACEWKEALYDLPRFYRNQMNQPLFSLGEMTSKWGYWSYEKTRNSGL